MGNENKVLFFEGWNTPYDPEADFCGCIKEITEENATPYDYIIVNGVIGVNDTVNVNSKWIYDGVGGCPIGGKQHMRLINARVYVKNTISAYVLGLCTE